MKLILSLFLLLSLYGLVCRGFTITSSNGAIRSRTHSLYMGRAAAVRANTKGRTDAAKAKNNGRFAKKIIMAVKAGGPDPAVNKNLAVVIAEAQVANVPKDIVNRNIDKAKNADTANFAPGVFEFYAYGGVGFIVNSLTDNNNRCASEINLVAKKNNLKPAAKNSVLFNFDSKARLDLNKMIDEDSLMEVCLENDIDDYILNTVADGSVVSPTEEGKCVVFVDVKEMGVLRNALLAKEYQVETCLRAVPKEGFMACSDEDYELNMAAMEAFEALDDVDSVEHNMDMTDPEE
jgi:YebC/PmpR family DNA-binding regulatory protein